MTKGLNNEQTEIRRWPYVKNMIYSYPSLCTLHQQALTQQITPTYSGLSGGSEGSRKTEQTVVRASTQTAAREYEAVHLAIQQTQQLDSGAERLQIIRRPTGSAPTLSGAALAANVSSSHCPALERRVHPAGGENYGLLD